MNKEYCEWPNLPKNIIVALAELKATRATKKDEQKKEQKDGKSRTHR